MLKNLPLSRRSRRYRPVLAISPDPRFTFKTSGADVSASIVYLEKRKIPLSSPTDDDKYSFAVELIEKVGWNLGDKKAAPIYCRNQSDGSFIVGSDGELALDADFDAAIASIRNSSGASDFPWLNGGIPSSSMKPSIGWSMPIASVINDIDLTLDPKRYSKKFNDVRAQIAAGPYSLLGDLITFIPEKTSTTGKRVRKDPERVYRHIELASVGQGDATPAAVRGWELPDRAKHFAEPGDIYVAGIWSSVGKWFLTPDSCDDVVVTNGCHRMRLKPGKEDFLPDLLAFFCTEAYRVQMRALARGSDGLAEITQDDAALISIPVLSAVARSELMVSVNLLKAGRLAISAHVDALISSGGIDYPQTGKRPSHVALV